MNTIRNFFARLLKLFTRKEYKLNSEFDTPDDYEIGN